jgi:hypothetical protein
MRQTCPHQRRDRAGIDGEQWHINTIRIALLRDGGKYYLKKQFVNETGGCMALTMVNKTHDMYLVDGYLNKSFLRVKQGSKRSYRQFHEGHEDREKWRHCVSIKGNKLFCAGLPDKGATTRNLHLSDTGRPDKNGYMERILRVYRIIENNM